MAASSKNKVSLRELMKRQRADPKTTKKKIDSPLAKYNNIGQLVCVVCSTQIKSDLLWPAHVQGKKHKENVAALKTKTQPVRTDTFVKPTTPILSTSAASVKRKSDTGAEEKSSHIEKKQKVPENTTSQSSRLPIDFFDESDSESSDEEIESSKSDQTATPSTSSSQLPADFFDSSVSSKSTVEESESSTSKTNTAEALPEGFFDDPVMDAKVRKVEVKDPMTEEWEKFQKSIAEETNVSEAIEAEEDEERQRERQIDEIDEQIYCLQKVEKLRDKKEEISTKSGEKAGQEDNEGNTSDTEEAEFEEFLDWRSKGAWR
ncbi:zinc finger protein 830-like [Glandiceps talaboti]